MHLPGPLRAAVGLVATAADEARRLPDRAVELPMLVVSTALQASVRAQQRYAGLTARGDAVLNRTQATEEPPAWATFDDPLSEDELARAPSRLDAVESLPVDSLPVDSLPVESAAQTARLVGELMDAKGAAEDAGEQAEGPNGTLSDAAPGYWPEEHPTRAPVVKTQPRQPPSRKKAPATAADGPTAQELSGATPDSEPADS